MNEPRRLWDAHWNPHLVEDFLWDRRNKTQRNTPYDLQQAMGQALLHIQSLCRERGLAFENYSLPNPPATTSADWFNDAIQRERTYDTEDQRRISDELLSKIHDNASQNDLFESVQAALQKEAPNVVYADDAAGTGKTTVYCAILADLRAQGKLALSHAFFGIAAQLLPGGRTTHSRFRLPVPLPLRDATCNVGTTSVEAKVLREAELLIFDEAPNMPLAAAEAIDQLMRELIGEWGKPFGGKVVVLGGDFRQIPPVILRIDPETLRQYTIHNATCFHDNKQ